MIIYKITNLINNKIYIGKTTKDKSDYFGSGILINRSIKKYGIENFKKEIIDIVDSIDELNKKEKYWIQYFNSNDLTIGYNIGKGGDGGDVFTNNPNKEEIRLKCSKPVEKNGMFGRNHTKESIEKISKNRKGKGRGISTWNKGLKKEDYTSEYKYKIEHQQRKYIEKSKKTYLVISPDGKLYELYGILQNFCKENSLPYTTLYCYIDKGKIKKSPRKSSISRINLIGWEIRSVKYHKTIDTHFFPNYIKIKISETRKKKNIKPSEKSIQSTIKRLKETCNGENNINAKTFYLISPNNEIFEVKGQLPTFCKEHDINLNVIRSWTNKGKIPMTCKKFNQIRENTNDWEIRTNMNVEIIENTKHYYILTSPKGEQYKLYNGLEKFCRQNNLWYDTFIDNVNTGKIRQPVFKFTPERINSVNWEIIRI